MSLPGRILKRFEWRLGLERRARAAVDVCDANALQALYGDDLGLDFDELREFMGPVASKEHADPLFKQRLKALLWSVMRHRRGRTPQLDRRLN